MGTETHSGSAVLGNVALPERYRLVRRIARGGMGTVWCADDAVLGRRVAIKLLAEQFIDDDRAVRRFKREARTAARLSGHANIITIFDVGEARPLSVDALGRPFIVMEHLTGGTVGDAIRVEAVDRKAAERWITQAASALDYAHERGVIHRDIKPGNLLLDGERTLHMADFGIARIATEDTITSTGQMMGTAAYISPEQALGNPATEASDRYALAVVAFELLAGNRPFTADHVALQARQHIEEEPPAASSLNPDLPSDVDAVLIRGMAKQPDQRWENATEFAAALRGALHEHPTRTMRRRAAAVPRLALDPARASGWAPRTDAPNRRQWTRRPRAIALAALGAGAFVVGAAIGGIGNSHSHNSARTGIAARANANGARAGTHRTSRSKSHTAASAPATHTTTTPTASSTSTTSTPSSAPSTTTPPTATSLEARGHQLMVDGQYAAAIPVLRDAVGASSPGSLNYAYALYDLGRSLRLAGDPRAAIPILQQRLQIPNQTGVVRHELDLALRAIGQNAGGPAGSGGTAPAPAPPGPQGPPGHDKPGHHHGGD